MSAVGRVVGALTLLVGLFALEVVPRDQLPAADASIVVPDAHCRRLDPNLVLGACLRYESKTGTAYTWIGSFRASNGRVFFCIDYLYDSRIAGSPTITGTQGLVNQFGTRIGDREVAALNYIVSTWAAHGSTGSGARDAAIGLIIRELMSDGIRPDGTVVYPRGLKVDQQVRPPFGGLSGPIMALASSMWTQASRSYGPYRLRLTNPSSAPIKLGTARTFGVSVLSAAGNAVPGVVVQFRCTGPVACPGSVRSGRVPVPVLLKPTNLGASTISASASAPAPDGRIYRVGSWHVHGGGTAQDQGVQRGWIAERSVMTAAVGASAVIVKGTPVVLTRSSVEVATPGAGLQDRVTVSGLPAGYHQSVAATLYGPFATQPTLESCTATAVAGSVSFVVDRAGEFVTPSVSVTQPGYYVWTETLPGDVRTNAVTTPCGVAAETTLVGPRTPTVKTVASAQRALVGARIYDTVVIGGLGAGDRVTVSWTLSGPLAPRGRSCAGLDWSGAGVVARGTFIATRNGSYRTAGTVLGQPGCVTFAEEMASTTTTAAAHSLPGQATETALVTRPVIPIVPEIASGPVGLSRAGVLR